MDYTLIANSGIQLMTFRLNLDVQNRFKMWFHEWYDTANGQWRLDLAHEAITEDATYYYDKHELFDGGYLNDPTIEFDVTELKADGILPLQIDDQLCPDVKGELYKITFADKHNKLSEFENKWLPLPYFFKRTEKRYKFGPLNWSRFKLIPRASSNETREYDVVIAFDTRAAYENNEYNEFPVFPDKYCPEMNFSLCDNEFYLMDFCSVGNSWEYIDKYLPA